MLKNSTALSSPGDTQSGDAHAFGGDFAQVLASLAAKSDAPQAPSHEIAAQQLAAAPRRDASAPVAKTHPKAAHKIALVKPRADANPAAQDACDAASKPAQAAAKPQTASLDEDTAEPVTVVAAVRPATPPQSVPVAAGETPQAPAPEEVLNAPVAAKADPTPAEQEAVQPPVGAKLAANVVAEIVAAAKGSAEQKMPQMVAQAAQTGKPAVCDKPAANAKTNASAAARVVVLDKTPPPAPQIVRNAMPQAVNKDAPRADPSQTTQSAETPSDQPEQDASAPQSAPSAQNPQPAQPGASANPPALASAQAATNMSAPAATTAQAPQTAPEQAPEPQPNVSALAAAIAARSASGAKMFEIRLDPAELGRVDVHLNVDRDGRAQASIVAERPETVALLQRDSQNLERALKDAGLDVSNSSLNFSLKGEGRQGDGGGASRAHARNLSDAVVARSEAVNASLASLSLAPNSARLDIRV